jgi:Peptidase family M28
MRNFILLPIVVAAAILLALIARTPPAPRMPNTQADSDFSVTKARALVGEIARAPHPVTTAEHARVREVLIARLQALGLNVETQTGTGVRQALRRGNAISVSPYTNIIAVLPGRDPVQKAVLVMAHYDSAPWSNSASDDGAGVAAVIETARVLASGPRPLRDTIFLLTDAEEVGMIGAQSFFDIHFLASKVGAAVNVEARGSNGLAIMFQTSPGNNELIDLWADHAIRPSGNSLANAVYDKLPNDTDLTVPLKKGIIGINAAFIDRFADYHMPTDNVANLDPRSLQHLGDYAVTTTRALANAPQLPNQSGEAAFFDFFGFGMIRYPLGLGWGVLLVSAIGLALSGFQTLGVSWRQAFSCAVGVLLLAAGTALASHILANMIYGPGTIAFRDRINEMNIAMWAFVGICAGITLFVRPKIAMWVGSVILLILSALAAQIWLPGANWMFAWAALIGVIMIAFAARFGLTSPISLYGSAFIGGLWGAMLLYGVITTYMTVGPKTPAPIVLIIPFVIALIGPVIIIFVKDWGRLIGGGLLLLSALALVWFAATDRFSARFPLPADFFHLTDANIDKSWWATSSTKRELPTGQVRQFIPRGFREIKWLVVPAPATNAPRPNIQLTKSADQVTITMSSTDAPRAMTFSLKPTKTLSGAKLNGRPVLLPADTVTRVAWRAEVPSAKLILEFNDASAGSIAIDYLYAVTGMPAGAPLPPGVPTDWAPYNATRTVSGSTSLVW